MKKFFQPLTWFVAIAIFVAGCSFLPAANSSPSQAPSAAVDTSSLPTGIPRLEGKATVEVKLKGGKVVIELDGTNAPVTAGNFVDLVQRGVYDGLVFHRVVREPEPFVVQGGDPQSKDLKFPVSRLGTGGFVEPGNGQPRNIPLEIKPEGAAAPIYHQTLSDAGISKPPVLKHSRGAVAMARSNFPDSASSQFYIALGNINFLDGSYAVFGYVTQGMELIDKVQQGDRIESAKVTQGIENLKAAKK